MKTLLKILGVIIFPILVPILIIFYVICPLMLDIVGTLIDDLFRGM